ncbi:hypothetical protein [Phormidesmis priestleyi]|uniref:hypothetical protein n=1 Tax=Phormidesmis priestleyi TaxID=268141 RepID=UPI000A463188|nr:hypothetical protein [Phormidesmis priestleyi]
MGTANNSTDFDRKFGSVRGACCDVQAIVGEFEPLQLVFAWTQATNVPLILGQVNFFMEFDVCFYGCDLYLI